jgi:TPR repeat protein
MIHHNEDRSFSMMTHRRVATRLLAVALMASLCSAIATPAFAQNAQTELQEGLKYYRGTGVPKDYIQAADHLRKAASKGNPDAAFWLAVMYEKGYGVTPDYPQAIQWYRKAADTGNTTAMNNLGFIYEHGKGTATDYAQAMTWYRKAADAGNSQAMDNIGELYLNGLGVARDPAQAMTWYSKAADIGNATAMIDVGMLYQNGVGTRRDYPQAEQWFRKALPTGGDSAQRHLDALLQLERAPIPPPPPPSDAAIAKSNPAKPAQEAKLHVFRAEEVDSLLQNGLESKRVATLVQGRGVSFALTPAIEKQLRADGADDALLVAIATYKKKT